MFFNSLGPVVSILSELEVEIRNSVPCVWIKETLLGDLKVSNGNC